MICPICNRDVQINPQTEMPCECCKSIIYEDETSVVKIIKSKVSFALDNFIFGILSLIGSILLVVFCKINDISFIILGLFFITGPLLGLLQHLLFYKSEVDLKNFIDLHRALIDKRLKYYDFGSRFFVYSLLIIQLSGICLLLLGLIY
jgi:hypothetical protein